MEEYIPKSALVAEIEKRQKEEVSYDEDGSFASWADQNHYSTLESLKNYVNTFEAKEVKLDEETLHSELRKIYTSIYDSKDVKSAKHFFELGLKAQKGINQ